VPPGEGGRDFDERRGPPGGRRGPRVPPEEERRNSDERARSEEKAVAAILTPEQAGRLEQIRLQQQGPFAFLEDEVVNELALTAAQRKTIRGVQDALRNEVWGRAPFPGRHEDEPKRQQLWLTATQEIVSGLSADQKARWQKMTGKPVAYLIPLGCPPGFDFRGGDDRGEGPGPRGPGGPFRNFPPGPHFPHDSR
jgi:hypothetical protein